MKAETEVLNTGWPCCERTKMAAVRAYGMGQRAAAAFLREYNSPSHGNASAASFTDGGIFSKAREAGEGFTRLLFRSGKAALTQASELPVAGRGAIELFVKPSWYVDRLTEHNRQEEAQLAKILDSLNDAIGDIDTKLQAQTALCKMALKLVWANPDYPEPDNLAKLERISTVLNDLPGPPVASTGGISPEETIVVKTFLYAFQDG